jgi:hypothetical protein
MNSMKTVDREFTAIIAKKRRWYTGIVREIPGVKSRLRRLIHLRRNREEAIQLIAESNRSIARKEHSQPIKRQSITARI